MPENHGLPYLFADDFVHQMLFYFGAVVATLIFLWEKFKGRPVQWRWILTFLLFCVFVSCFQAWVDEHRNATLLIEQKAQLTSEKAALESKLDNKQIEIDWLRDHREVLALTAPAGDPRVSRILEKLNQENEALKARPGMELKKGIVRLSAEMIEFFQREKGRAEEVTFESPASSSITDPQELRRLWEEHSQKVHNAWHQMEADIGAAMSGNYGPRALTLLEELRDKGESGTGIKESEVQEALNSCSSKNASASYWGIQACTESLSVIAQKMR